MPDLGNLMNPPSLTLSVCPNFKPISEPSDPNISTYLPDSKQDEIRGFRRIGSENAFDRNIKCLDDHVKAPTTEKKVEDDEIRVARSIGSGGAFDRNKKCLDDHVKASTTEKKVEDDEIRGIGSGGAFDRNKKCLDDHVKASTTEKTVESGGDVESRCFLPFLVGAPKMVKCLNCHKFVNPGEDVLCSVRSCRQIYHLTCAKKEFRLSTSKKFKCPHHECFLCKQKLHWRCVRCSMASHDKCAAWPQHVIHFGNHSALAICWRHPSDWRLEKEDVFSRLPLPYVEEEFTVDTAWKDVMENKVEPAVEEEFTVDIAWKDVMENKVEPSPYVHIKRNLYLIKKKREDVGDGTGCTNCRSTCCEDCVCRGQYISCSKSCHCSDACKNRPFRKEKKIKVVKTESCGWGVEAVESINKGDFIIEYIGEVINDASCEQRLWDMKYKGVQNFYMCEIRKNFIIDATFKGNSSRFLNHSCDPNCVLEKWQVDGETRVGVFAARSIKVGEPLTYDYRFVQFGPEVKCRCGASNCQGYLGTLKRKIVGVNFYWGSKPTPLESEADVLMQIISKCHRRALRSENTPRSSSGMDSIVRGEPDV